MGYKMKIFNMTNRDKGQLSIFTGSEWLKLDGEHAAFIYNMQDKIDKLTEENEQLKNDNVELINNWVNID